MRGAWASGGKVCFKLVGKPVRQFGGVDDGPKHADHVEDFGNAALVEGVHGDTSPDQRRHDVGLEIGKAQDEIGLQVEDFGMSAVVKAETRGLLRRASGGRTQ